MDDFDCIMIIINNRITILRHVYMYNNNTNTNSAICIYYNGMHIQSLSCITMYICM